MIWPDGLFRGKFLVLDSIRDWIYHLFVMGSVDSELYGRECRAAYKSKLLSLRIISELYQNWLKEHKTQRH